MGIKHVRGVLLHGPPGTGKTLIARQIGLMLQGREPKVVNGPEVLNKYVGESEANIRRLFEEAEKEQQERGDKSSLHVIIFDEIDAICKSRGSTSSGTGVQDSLVNQLLSKIDGVGSLNNVLLIGMTNRIDLLDEALLRPGRFELKIKVGLPNEDGREQIFRIHTKKLVTNNMLADDVDAREIAKKTRNFSGAEIEGLVRCATSYAINQCVDSKNLQIDQEKLKSIKVASSDFDLALKEIVPAFGVPSKDLERCTANGIVIWGEPMKEFVREGELLLDLIRHSERTNLVSVLIEGTPLSGKTALAAHLATLSGFPMVRFVSAENMVGFHAKLQYIHRMFEDAYRSPQSVVIVDDIERIIDYCPLGERFSNALLQALMVLVKKASEFKLLIICTTSNINLMNYLGISQLFFKVLVVPHLTSDAHIMAVLAQDSDGFTATELEEIRCTLPQKNRVGIKSVYLNAEIAKQSQDNRAHEFLSSFPCAELTAEML